MQIALEVFNRIGAVPTRINERTARILAHYERTWERSRNKSHLYLDQLVQRCISDLARGNGLDNQRTEVSL